MENWDLIVIGAGPAGLSAAIWGSDLGLRTLIIEERSEGGGQLLNVHNPIKNYPGKDALNGRELRDAMFDQAWRSKAVLRLSSKVTFADLAKKVILLDNAKLTAHAFIISTGVRRRLLGVSGECEFAGRGILESGIRDQGEVAGLHVVIIGGGDAALENALILSDRATRVTIIHRGNSFRAREQFLADARQRRNVEFILNSTIRRIVGESTVEGVEICGQESRTIHCDKVLIRIGVEPNSELFRDQIRIDQSGYVIVDRDCRTSLTHVFAAGDIASPMAPTISTAGGMAATAVKVIAMELLN